MLLAFSLSSSVSAQYKHALKFHLIKLASPNLKVKPKNLAELKQDVIQLNSEKEVKNSVFNRRRERLNFNPQTYINVTHES